MKRFKYNDLYGKICAVCGSIAAFAEKVNKTPDTVSAKLKGRSPWKDKEIDVACAVLGIPKDEILHYFFA